MRAIEIAKYPAKPGSGSLIHESSTIGLRYSDDKIQHNKITERVKQRLQLGAVEETKELLKEYGSDLQSMSAIGYQSIIKFLENKLSESEMIESWVVGELAYSKRQMTWFRKQSVIWYDI